MKFRQIFGGQMSAGLFVPDNKPTGVRIGDKYYSYPTYREKIKSLQGQRVELTIEPADHPRSQNQLSFYWSILVGQRAKHEAVIPESIHKYFTQKYLKYIIRGDERGPVYITDVSCLTQSEFTYFIKLIVAGESEYFVYNFPNKDMDFF